MIAQLIYYWYSDARASTYCHIFILKRMLKGVSPTDLLTAYELIWTLWAPINHLIIIFGWIWSHTLFYHIFWRLASKEEKLTDFQREATKESNKNETCDHTNSARLAWAIHKKKLFTKMVIVAKVVVSGCSFLFGRVLVFFSSKRWCHIDWQLCFSGWEILVDKNQKSYQLTPSNVVRWYDLWLKKGH